MKRQLGDSNAFWIDLTNPTAAELQELAEQHGLHSTSVKDSLDPNHLPKFEVIENTRFFILRQADIPAFDQPNADTVRELTRKLAIFISQNGVITIHRSTGGVADALFEEWTKRGVRSGDLDHLVNDLIKRVFLSYAPPMRHAEEVFEKYELQVLDPNLRSRAQRQFLDELYFLKRKVAVYKKMLRANLEATARNNDPGFRKSPFYQDVREEGDRQFYHAEELVEDVNHLMQTQLSMASFRTNEVMRVLTLFSVFFLPLTFIVGVYGMNFDFMPELHWTYGYPMTIGVMIAVTLAIWYWFRRKRWL